MRPIAFDLGWRAAGALVPAVAQLVADCLRLEAAYYPRTRRRRPDDARRFTDAVEAVLCNVAAVELAAPGAGIATPRGGGGLLVERYGETFLRVLDVLTAGSLLRAERGARQGGRKPLTCSVALPALLAYLPRLLTPEVLCIEPSAELELRSAKSASGTTQVLPLPATAEALRMREELETVAAWLAAADVRKDGAAVWLHAKDDAMPRIWSTRHARLRRVFNNGKMNHGGRVVHGWWQGMGKAQRLAELRIQGERVVELDYTAAVPRLCYALRGVAWPFGDDKDAAYIAGPQADRSAWKEWTLALLAARRALHSWPGGTPADQSAFGARFSGLSAGQARRLVLAHHGALAAAGGFGCGLSMEAMRLEADISVAVVLALRARDIVALPVFDAFTVAERYADEAVALMRSVPLGLNAGAHLSVSRSRVTPTVLGEGRSPDPVHTASSSSEPTRASRDWAG